MYTAERGEHTVIASQPGGVASRLLDHVSAMDDDTLTTRARELAGEISAAEANLAAVLAEIERRQIHSRWECTTVERFATWHCQINPSTARGLLAVGRSLSELPVVAEAVADGTLSFDKAKPIARVASPSTEGALVQMGVHATVAQTQRICGKWRHVEDQRPPDADAQGENVVDARPTVIVVRDEEAVELTVRFDHVRGEMVLAGIDTAAAEVRAARKHAASARESDANDPTGRPAGVEDQAAEKLTRNEWRAEGLLRLLERGALDTGTSDGSLRGTGFDTTVVVHVGIDTLYGPDLPAPTDADGRNEASTPSGDTSHPTPAPGRPTDEPGWEQSHRPERDGMAELEPAGIRIRRDIARWLACDAGILTVIDDRDGNPLHLGRRRNPIPTTLRRAVMARHRTCTWPGCCATAVQLHHIHHRAHGGHDDIEALAPQCPTHHRTTHLDRITVTVDRDGTFHHWRPDGTEIRAVPPGPPPDTEATRAPHVLARRRLDLGADPDETARMPRWIGDPLDLGLALDALVSRRDQALRRTRPTTTPPAPRYDGPPPHPN